MNDGYNNDGLGPEETEEDRARVKAFVKENLLKAMSSVESVMKNLQVLYEGVDDLQAMTEEDYENGTDQHMAALETSELLESVAASLEMSICKIIEDPHWLKYKELFAARAFRQQIKEAAAE